jgi:hypothetical protein
VPEPEEWRYAFNFPEYIVSSLGNIRRAGPHSGRPLSLFADDDGNIFVFLTVDGHTRNRYRLDRLVAASFLMSTRGRPLSMDILHIDGDPTNCRVDNLKWVERRRDESEYGNSNSRQTRRNDRQR